jgi:CRISPR system Cascade subunit CasD
MKHTLLLRFKAPMQSWGTQSRFSIRDTGLEPSKSGVIGLLCAALGKPREESHTDDEEFAELLNLRMGVLVLREGVMRKDFHTALEVVKADSKGDGKSTGTVTSNRYYLSDADFLVGLEHSNFEFLEKLENKLKNPHWQMFLGRKSFVPSLPVYLEKDGLIRESRLEKSLTENNFSQAGMRLVLEASSGENDATEIRQDVPLCLKTRRFSIRRVETKFIKGGENDGNLSDQIAA